MATLIKGKYLDNLRCELVHDKSKTTLLTDAPTDNNGKGESFSPTDLLAAGLGSCMLTIIAIRARTKNISIGQPDILIEKEMTNNPRRISKIRVEIDFYSPLTNEERMYLEEEARKCPVALSLSEQIEQDILFRYN